MNLNPDFFAEKMATLEFKLRGVGAEGELISINLPGCLDAREVVELLVALESKVGHHLQPETSAKIKLLTGGPQVDSKNPVPVQTAKASPKERRRLAAAKQVGKLSGKVCDVNIRNTFDAT